MSDKTAKPADTVKVRVIADHAGHKINDVVTMTAEEAKAARAAGWADADPAAVAYAESIAPAPADEPAA